MSSEGIELRRIREKLAALNGDDWQLCCEGDVSFVEAKTRHGELNRICTFHPGATPDEIDMVVGALGMAAFMLKLVDRAIVAVRQTTPRQSAPRESRQRKHRDFAAEAAMKCDDAAFKMFLEEQHGLEGPLTSDRAAQRLRSILNIKSRKELNENSAAAERWQDLRAAFEAWKRVGR
ncbi:hypothetical protein CQ052_05175 [Ochrobactrum sp. MYb15]|nr:hypothetical protein CQZ90_03715 [Ochrobactrum sp. MYb19]PRA62589.1 hypothetical protein CQ053_17100 [Ochrobactrum sp. MYb18]PRA76757.1 hypothetical protein CQ049_05175 [Brucella thiophenivorans]PRA93609.1 hypothetical protein CQ051_03715 [Ochrobactrum sp. MYb14]PRA98764.1 hypothetical protein CQ052_05175 [Ochrobactrum sp. MYb15]